MLTSCVCCGPFGSKPDWYTVASSDNNNGNDNIASSMDGRWKTVTYGCHETVSASTVNEYEIGMERATTYRQSSSRLRHNPI